MDKSTPEEFWEQVLSELELKMARATFDMWLRSSHCATMTRSDDHLHLVIVVKNSYAQDWLNGRLHPLILRTLARFAELNDDQIDVDYVVGDPPAPEDDEDAGVEVSLVHFNPEDAGGFTITSNYATQFWQPFLGVGPWAFWQTLRSFAWRVQNSGVPWPSLRHLAEICANGNTQTLTGRKSTHDPGGWITGWLQILERESLVFVEAGEGRYKFAIVDRLPFLTPKQVGQLSDYLQRQHERYLRAWEANMGKAGCNVEEWFTLDAETLVTSPAV